jgi:tetratricopeptide (TPR) repeat protein
MPQANELKLLHRAVIDAFEHTSPSKWRGIVKEVLERKLDDIRKLYPIQMEKPPTGFLKFLEEYADWKRLIAPLAILNESAFGRHFWTNLVGLTRAMPIDELQPYATECAAMLMRETVATFSSRPLSKAEELNDAGYERHHAGGYKDAIPMHDQAIEIQPRFSLASINKGIALKNLGRLDEAIACYDHVIQEIDPEYKKAWHNKGVALKVKGKLDAAIQCFDRALELDPDYDIARKVRETCMVQQPGEAVHTGMQLPKNQQAVRLMLMGAELANRGNWAAAAKLYAQAQGLEPDNAWSLTVLGEALVECNQIREAKKHLERAIEVDGKCGMAWLNLVWCYLPSALLGLSRFSEAVEAARKSLRLDSRNHVALYNLGVSLWKLNMIREARETLDRFVEWYPDSPASESARTICEWMGGDKR